MGGFMSNPVELLRRALDVLSYWSESKANDLQIEIRAYLDAEPEAEPVGLIHSDGTFELLSMDEINFGEIIPLYTRPEPTRKPLTDDDMWRVYIKAIEDDHRISGCGLFILGVRFAEKHHGLIPRRENS
jgi:hypothetical protein